MYIHASASDEEKIEKLRLYIARDRDKDQRARKTGYFIYRIPVGQHIPVDWYEQLKSLGFDEF
jgi:hypothetical protein